MNPLETPVIHYGAYDLYVTYCIINQYLPDLAILRSKSTLTYIVCTERGPKQLR